MSWLPNDVARCDGKAHDGPGGVIHAPGCINCLRRTAPVSGNYVWLMEPPQDEPCPERLAEVAP